jgi:hypothetical protein
MNPGDVVRFHEVRGWRFGVLLTEGHKWARVRVAGSVQKVLLEDITAWPPERISAPAKQVRRGAA